MRTAAEALKASGVKQPLALKLDEWFVESWINGAGEGVTNKDNGREGLADEATFDNPATRELYTWIKAMADDGLLVGYSDTAGQINQYLAVAQKNSAMTHRDLDRGHHHQGRARGQGVSRPAGSPPATPTSPG